MTEEEREKWSWKAVCIDPKGGPTCQSRYEVTVYYDGKPVDSDKFDFWFLRKLRARQLQQAALKQRRATSRNDSGGFA